MAHKERPSLYPSEMALQTAWRVLGEMDPEATMTVEEAEGVLARYVNTDAALVTRDEFVEFVLQAEARAAGIEAHAAALVEPMLKEARALRDGAERMKASAVKLMKHLGVDELIGHVRSAKLKNSRGAVKVWDESAIPDRFLRVKDDADMRAIEALLTALEGLARESVVLTMKDSTPVNVDAAIAELGAVKVGRALRLEAALRRTAVDKVAIQKFYKESGSERPITPEEAAVRAKAGFEPVDMVPTVPGAELEIVTTLVLK